MTVRELIAKLQDMPPEAKVLAREGDGGYFEVQARDVRVQTRTFYPAARGPGGYGYWHMADPSDRGQMVVVIAP